MDAMKIISINIEQDKHLQRVREFLLRERADVVVLLEASESDLDFLLSEYPQRLFLPNFRFQDGRQIGVAMASKVEMTSKERFYCDGDLSKVPLHGLGTHRPAVVGATFEGVQIYATHFTWTPDMSETEAQHQHLDYLLARLAGKQMVLCGDFNIPRGNEAYAKLAKCYKDNIPSEVVTTIDPLLHRANLAKIPPSPIATDGHGGILRVVVDYIWSTPKYTVSQVRVVSGVSDHCGLVGEISLVNKV